jgi:hypothetical protein
MNRAIKLLSLLLLLTVACLADVIVWEAQARGASNSDWEFALGPSGLGSGIVTGQYSWTNGSPAQYQLTYNGSSVSFTLGGTTIVYAVPGFITNVQIWAQVQALSNPYTGGSVTITNNNTSSLPSLTLQSSTNTQAAGNTATQTYQITPNLNMQGNITLSWDAPGAGNPPPAGSILAVRILGINAVPEPSPASLCAIGLVLLALSRFAKRAAAVVRIPRQR